MPDVIEFNKMIHINQVLSSKIGNEIIKNYYKSYFAKSYKNKQEKGQNELKFDLINMQVNHQK